MSQILNKVRGLDPHDVDAAKEALSTFFPNLAKHRDSDYVQWLRTLENVINRFPRLCGSQRATIEKYISFFLDTSSYSAAIEAAKCAHALQQVRPGQEKAATPKVCWRELMSTLCNAVHSLISELFPNAADIYETNGEQEKHSSDSILLSALSEISVVSGQDRILNREKLLSTRLRNVFIFIQAMLVEVYPVAKPVRPQLILDAVIRALAAGASQSTELVCAVKQQALGSLDALVACLGSNLIPFSPLVFKCVMQTLRWSSDNPSQNSSSVRSAAYSSLGRWLSRLRSHRAPARSWRELVAHVRGDVTPLTRLVQLTMNNPPRNLSKKQKKKQVRVALQQSSIAAYSPGEADKLVTSAESSDQTVIAALECTEIFLTVCGIFLEPTTHKTFHELLVRECFHLEDYSSERGIALLRALEASRRSAPPGVPPPTQYCLQLYSAMINSQHREISKFCSQGLLDIRLHLHCSPPSLSFAAEAQKETKKDAEEKRIMSRRNREALESLLGADKIPPETSDKEAPEPEEPLNKKPRIDDISDKISLSSGSESVEICDSDSEIEEVPMVSETSILEVHAEIHNNTEDSPEIREVTKINEISKNINELPNIHEAPTQVYDTVDGESLSGKSNEVSYGYTNTRSVPVLENIEDDLPNTDDTDDVHITCGQTVTTPEELKESGDAKDEVNVNSEVKDEVNVNSEVKDEVNVNSEVKINSEVTVKVNGATSPEADENVVEGSVTVKMVANGVSVEDMLADFVDEVNDDITQA